jgi:TetR/AcrR family transcriptional regulator, tetracycline repressor protein
VSPEKEKQRGLTRERLVETALELIAEEGLEALSMRALADRLDVKAASLYWHVRDRRELLELVAESMLESIPQALARGGWRQSVLASGAALRRAVATQRDGDRVLLEVREALQRSRLHGAIKEQLESAGLQPAEAGEVALMVMVSAIAGQVPTDDLPVKAGSPASIAIDSGSRGVVLRQGSDMQTLFRLAHDRKTAAPAVVRGETVIVRRLRGVGEGEIELNPRHPWTFRVQGPTWNTTLDVGGLDVRGIKIDSGAARVECFLPEPRGVVPIIVSGGVVGVKLHRPPGVAVVAAISGGALRVRLDEFSSNAVVTDLRWSSEVAAKAADRYELRISGGAVQVSLDSATKSVPRAEVEPAVVPVIPGKPVSALEILLDGVESRVRSRGK